MQENATIAEEQVTQAADDLDLLLRMTFKDENREDAEAALAEFFRRYQTPLFGFAKSSGFRALGWNPEDFVLRTFEKAFEKAGSFKAPSGLTPENLRLKIQSWLFQIAKNEFLMEFRKPERKQEAPTEKEQEEAETQVPLPEKAPKRFDLNALQTKKAAVRTFLEALPETDKEMLVISMNFYDFKTGKAHIPNNILEGLANAMGTTLESIKTKRARLLRKLEEYLDTKT
jgi:RNA polymerase sigma factor (sigma-70 family)